LRGSIRGPPLPDAPSERGLPITMLQLLSHKRIPAARGPPGLEPVAPRPRKPFRSPTALADPAARSHHDAPLEHRRPENKPEYCLRAGPLHRASAAARAPTPSDRARTRRPTSGRAARSLGTPAPRAANDAGLQATLWRRRR